MNMRIITQPLISIPAHRYTKSEISFIFLEPLQIHCLHCIKNNIIYFNKALLEANGAGHHKFSLAQAFNTLDQSM